MPGPLVTRFAPSPTGHLHIGGARSAMFCWAFAKSQGGRFLIRIEDTDQARSSEESARGILEDLAWLGIEWDDGPELKMPDSGRGPPVIGGDSRNVGPYFQARRVPTYNAYIDYLMSIGRAYPAFETQAETDLLRKAAVARKETFRYTRPADFTYGQACTTRIERARAGEPHVVRFAMDAEAIVVHDQVLGDVKIAPGEVDDFVIRKADGFPIYHFAVVIDDELMGVTHVMRAQEHLANTPRHVALQRALKRLDTGEAFRTPAYAHMPLIFNMDGTKMSKRDKAKAARKVAKDALAKAASTQSIGTGMLPVTTPSTPSELAAAANLDPKLVADFFAGENDNLDVATALAKFYKIALPEIEVWDFRQNGYLPEAITNFLGLLGWNPGMKLEDGKDLEKFDMAFIARNFSLERIGRTNAKFDRAKLLSFNADAIALMSDEQFVARWLDWLKEYEPVIHARIAGLDHARQLVLARALKPRTKTLRDAVKPIGFLIAGDAEYHFDAAAVDKSLKADNGAGLRHLRTLRERLGGLSEAEWKPETIHAMIEQLAQQSAGPDGKAAMGPVSQAVRVAVTGSTVSPGMGETLTVLGRTSTLARMDRCLAACTT